MAAFVLLRSGDSSRTSTRTQLRAGAAHAQPALTRALGATRLEDLHTTASLAEDAQQPMATVVGAASTIPNVRYRTVAESALRAERSYVSDLARLSGLSTRDLSGWDATKTALQRDALALSAARPRVSSLQLRGAGPLLIAPEDASRAVAAIDRVVRRAERLLRSWSIDVRHVRAHNRQAVETVTSYAATMRGYLGSYDKLRGDTSAWITKVDTDGETFDHAYQFLDDAIASRQTLKDSLGGLRAPTPALAAAQSQLTHTLGDSIQAMSDAESGISDYQFSLDYTNYKETPGWSQFEKASDSVAGEYASARAEWEAQVAKRLKTVRSRGLPPRPSV